VAGAILLHKPRERLLGRAAAQIPAVERDAGREATLDAARGTFPIHVGVCRGVLVDVARLGRWMLRTGPAAIEGMLWWFRSREDRDFRHLEVLGEGKDMLDGDVLCRLAATVDVVRAFAHVSIHHSAVVGAR
jgi:hypothetical protein